MSPRFKKLSFPILFLALNLITIKLFTTNVSAYTASLSTSGTINLNVSASGNGANIATDNVAVTSTCPLGYTLSVSGPTNNNLYKNGDSTSTSRIYASAGTKASPVSILGNNLNTWGFTTGSNITINSNFIGLTNTAIELATSSTASASGGDTIPVTYGASASTTLEPGLYKLSESTTGANDDVITYYLTTNPNCDQYTVRYNGNNADTSTTMSVTHNITSPNQQITLYASNFKRTSVNGGAASTSHANLYGFAGWSTIQLNPNASDAKARLAAAVQQGKVYGPNQTITADQNFLSEATIENNQQYITLYAVWVKSEGNLQGWSSCSSLSSGEVIALTDNRDNNTYAVAKLADDKCWVIENLRLADKDVNNSAIVLSSQNTNNPSLPIVNSRNQSTGVVLSSSNSLSASRDPRQTAWCTSNSIGCYDQSMLYAGSTTNPISDMSSTNGGSNADIYSYGNYYNWYSVTAGNGTRAYNTGDAAGSICPAGWHLPTGGYTTGEYFALNTAANNGATNTSSGMRAYPNNFIYSGDVYSSSIEQRGTNGGYWSLTTQYTAYNYSNYSYTLYFSGSSISPGTSLLRTKLYGQTARCIMSVATSYTIEFDSNGGSGTMSNQTPNVGQTVNLSTNTFTPPTNRAFMGWNTSADGSGTSYTNGQSVTDLAPAGGTITLYAQWGCPSNRICYDDNGANSPTTMSNQTITSNATSATLWASNFKRPLANGIGYGFAGWNTEPDYSGTNYGPNETIYFSAGTYSTEGLMLYAHWIEWDSVASMTMQSFATTTIGPSNPCAALNEGDVIALPDERDGNVYAVAKLADGNCWMIENLRLADKDANNNTVILSNQNTNNPSLPIVNSRNQSTGAVLSSSNSLSASQDPNQIAWCTTDTANCNDQSMVYTGNTTNPVANMTTPESNVYSYGNYYNWYSATAGSGTYNVTYGEADGSICPRGWYLPTGGVNGGEFGDLDTAMGGGGSDQSTEQASIRWREYPNNFVYSGVVNGSSVTNRGEGNVGGVYWSSTTSSSQSAYRFVVQPLEIIPDFYNPKYMGSSVRCMTWEL